jgi:hypothetical protein
VKVCNSASQTLVDEEALKTFGPELSRYSLAKGSNIEVGLRFVKPAADAWPEGETSVLTGDLQITFTNGSVQVIKLECTVQRPWIHIASDHIDEDRSLVDQNFGCVHLT